MRPVDLIIPVYDGYQETLDCLASVLDTVDYEWARIVIINDCSPDQRITHHLRKLRESMPRLVLLENERNLGFVATANRGMSYDEARDVVLLNSDVEVAGDWLSRLREAAYFHDDVASVTPFSNNATVCSFPNVCEDNELLFGLSVREIDAQFNREFSVSDVFQIPTGVGCCMYMRRDCLSKVGYFDQEAFGRGYGEENDWCQRAVASGRRNLHLANCFVYHRGGVSFGNEHDPRLARALDTLDKKYPRYHADIQRFIARDPAKQARVTLWLRLFEAQHRPKALMICHKLGGGAQQHVEELASLYAARAMFLLLVPERDGESVRLSCYDDGRVLRDSLVFDIGREYDKLLALLSGLGIGRVHLHHTMGLPTRLWGLAADLGCDYDLTIHDYYLVNGNPSLTDKEARYVDEDAADFDARCAGHRPLPPGVDADLWRRNQAPLVEGARRVIFPSQDAAERFARYFKPARSVVAWHPDHLDVEAYPAPAWNFPADRPLRVLALGALSREKGADVLDAVAASMAGQNIEFHLLGYAYRGLGGAVICHGPYDNDEVDALVQSVAPDLVWFPALWPETYSYTLSVALRHGLPVVVPDIGAFRERVQGRAHSAIVPWNLNTSEWRAFWMKVLVERALPVASAAVQAHIRGASRGFYLDEYAQVIPAVATEELAPALLKELSANVNGHKGKLSRSEQVLKRIWRFSRRPVVARLIAMVPFETQRSIKRYLSHRPMHEIVGK